MACLSAGSCLVLKGNGADVAPHCVPPVSARRMSITLRRYSAACVCRYTALPVYIGIQQGLGFLGFFAYVQLPAYVHFCVRNEKTQDKVVDRLLCCVHYAVFACNN